MGWRKSCRWRPEARGALLKRICQISSVPQECLAWDPLKEDSEMLCLRLRASSRRHRIDVPSLAWLLASHLYSSVALPQFSNEAITMSSKFEKKVAPSKRHF